ncbi:MAG: protein phosphatase CheZ [Rhodospirillales bacterium]
MPRTSKSLTADIGSRLEKLKDSDRETVQVAEIASLLDDAIQALHRPMPPIDPRFYLELESLADYIRNTRSEIAALRPDTVKEEYLQTASDELDAIVAATADATNAIMDATEQIEAAAAETSDAVKAVLTAASTDIYEACTFQDITGQRITKVIDALKGVEEKIDGLLKAFGPDAGDTKAARPPQKKAPKESKDDNLLNGPQKPGEAKSQDEIDAIFNSLD